MAERDANFYRPEADSTESYSTKELQHRLALTGAIAKNLRMISADKTDLDALQRRLENIATALVLVRELADAANLKKTGQTMTTGKVRRRLVED